MHDNFASFHTVLISQMTQLLKGQVSKGFASCPVPQKEVGNVEKLLVPVPFEKRHSPWKRFGLFDVIWNKVHVYVTGQNVFKFRLKFFIIG